MLEQRSNGLGGFQLLPVEVMEERDHPSRGRRMTVADNESKLRLAGRHRTQDPSGPARRGTVGLKHKSSNKVSAVPYSNSQASFEWKSQEDQSEGNGMSQVLEESYGSGRLPNNARAAGYQIVGIKDFGLGIRASMN